MENSIHMRQLFHWIGTHIKEPADGDVGARRYLQALKESVESGLWFSTSHQESATICNLPNRKTMPMICFTDNKISECGYHASKYGKLALGFPKKFVIKHAGIPVNYVDNKFKGNHYLEAIAAIDNFLQNQNDSEIAKHWQLITNYIKPLSDAPSKPITPRASEIGKSSGIQRMRLAHRNFGGKQLKYYVENEWRIVLCDKLRKNKDVYLAVDKYKLKYTLEEDLFTLILPSRRVYEMMRCEETALYERIRQSSNLNTFVIDEISQL